MKLVGLKVADTEEKDFDKSISTVFITRSTLIYFYVADRKDDI